MGRFSDRKSVVKQDNMVVGINNIADLFCCVFFYQVLTKHG